MRTILPPFDRFPEEGSIIGRLVTGYGELEYELALCVSWIIEDRDTAFKVVYRAGGEMQRILMGDALGRRRLEAGKFRTLFEQAIAAMHVCRKIRNQYAHCNWGYDDDGLWFVNPQDAANEHDDFLAAEMEECHADLILLQEQEQYFCHVVDCFHFLTYAVRAKRKEIPTSQHQRAPKSVPAPKLHS
jgi:hypothetical protein